MKTFLSFLFGLFVQIRRAAYRLGFLKTVRLNKPVISIGNLTVGGTGKTPVVDALLERLESRGLSPCVLTRGYGRKGQKTMVVSSIHSTSEVGDEPKWLFNRHHQTKILVSKQRARAALNVKDVDVFLLDDGRQHLKIHRDLEITLIDSTRSRAHYELLPKGRARESWNELSRSDVVILTKVNQANVDFVESTMSRVRSAHFEGPIFQCSLSAVDLRDIFTNMVVLDEVESCFLISGIANPASFENLVKQYIPKTKILGHNKLRDHAPVTKALLQKFLSAAETLNAQIVITTEKDAIKWREVLTQTDCRVKICILETALTFKPELPDFYDMALSKFN